VLIVTSLAGVDERSPLNMRTGSHSARISSVCPTRSENWPPRRGRSRPADYQYWVDGGSRKFPWFEGTRALDDLRPQTFSVSRTSCFPRIFGDISIELKSKPCTEREFFNRIGQEPLADATTVLSAADSSRPVVDGRERPLCGAPLGLPKLRTKQESNLTAAGSLRN
jgi:hypothetical protein